MPKPLQSLTTLVAFAAVLAVPAVRADQAPRVHIPDASNFALDGRVAEQRQLPLMVVFTSEYCSYCQELEADFIRPMIISGDYTDKVIIRRVQLDGYGPLRDFDGSDISVDDFSLRYRIRVTPTVVFLGPHGRSLVKPLVGIATPDFYGGELDNAIDSALSRMHASLQASKL